MIYEELVIVLLSSCWRAHRLGQLKGVGSVQLQQQVVASARRGIGVDVATVDFDCDWNRHTFVFREREELGDVSWILLLSWGSWWLGRLALDFWLRLLRRRGNCAQGGRFHGGVDVELRGSLRWRLRFLWWVRQ